MPARANRTHVARPAAVRRAGYNGGKSALGPRTETYRSYLVLTEVEDRELRMTLIRHALRVVAESVRRRREREAAMEDSE